MVIIAATANKNKIKEIGAILGELSIDVISSEGAGFKGDIEENGDTFEENALIKAKTLCEFTGKPCIADDSGLCVDALGGRPGVYSARYSGEDATDLRNNGKLLYELRDVPPKERSARFVCAIAFVHPDGTEFTVRGEMEGEITFYPAGENGFGYDPLFYLKEYGMTSAQLSPAEKNAISHRGKALQKLLEKLKKREDYANI